MAFTEVASKAQMALQLPHTFRPHKVIIMIILNKYFIMCLYFRNSNKFGLLSSVLETCNCSVHTSRSRHLGRSETLRERPDMCWANPETFSFLTSSHPLDSSTRYTTWRCYKLNSDDTRCFTAHKHLTTSPPTSNTSFTFWVCRCEKVISGWWPPQSVEPLGCRYFVTIWSQFQWFKVSVLQSFNASQLQWLTVWMPHSVIAQELIWLICNQLNFDTASKLPQVCFFSLLPIFLIIPIIFFFAVLIRCTDFRSWRWRVSHIGMKIIGELIHPQSHFNHQCPLEKNDFIPSTHFFDAIASPVSEWVSEWVRE